MLKKVIKNKLVEIIMKELEEKFKEDIQKQLKEYQDSTYLKKFSRIHRNN
jgi:hypothetical protein